MVNGRRLVEVKERYSYLARIRGLGIKKRRKLGVVGCGT